MKLSLTNEQAAELEIVFKALDAGQVCVGQIRRSLYPDEDAGTFTLHYTLVQQPTAHRIRTIIEKEREKRAARVTPQ